MVFNTFMRGIAMRQSRPRASRTERQTRTAREERPYIEPLLDPPRTGSVIIGEKTRKVIRVKPDDREGTRGHDASPSSTKSSGR